MKYDVMIPAAGKDISFLPWVVKYCRKMLQDMEKIYIVVPSAELKACHKNLRKCMDGVLIIDENNLLPGLSFSTVKQIISTLDVPNVPVGWFFQQFLKYAFALSKYAKSYYLTWDADTLPLNKLTFFDEGKPLFTMKKECHANYFLTIKRLLGWDKTTSMSFIAEHMMFNTNVVKELIDSINKSSVEGTTWFEKIIRACNFDVDMNAYSEFETYGTFCQYRHQGMYDFRQLCTFRKAGIIRGRFINENLLKSLAFDLDIASFEIRDMPPFPYCIMNYARKVMWFIQKYYKG